MRHMLVSEGIIERVARLSSIGYAHRRVTKVQLRYTYYLIGGPKAPKP